MSRTQCAVILGFILFGAPQARAAVWAINGASCTPDDITIYAHRHATINGAVTFGTGMNTPITLYCPISTAPPSCPSTYRLRLTYRDSDGTSGQAGVTAQLMRRSQANGSVLSAVPGSQVSSNSKNATGPTNEASPAFEHDFSQLTDYYFVRIDMNRYVTATGIATFYGVALECSE